MDDDDIEADSLDMLEMLDLLQPIYDDNDNDDDDNSSRHAVAAAWTASNNASRTLPSALSSVLPTSQPLTLPSQDDDENEEGGEDKDNEDDDEDKDDDGNGVVLGRMMDTSNFHTGVTLSGEGEVFDPDDVVSFSSSPAGSDDEDSAMVVSNTNNEPARRTLLTAAECEDIVRRVEAELRNHWLASKTEGQLEALQRRAVRYWLSLGRSLREYQHILKNLTVALCENRGGHTSLISFEDFVRDNLGVAVDNVCETEYQMTHSNNPVSRDALMSSRRRTGVVLPSEDEEDGDAEDDLADFSDDEDFSNDENSDDDRDAASDYSPSVYTDLKLSREDTIWLRNVENTILLPFNFMQRICKSHIAMDMHMELTDYLKQFVLLCQSETENDAMARRQVKNSIDAKGRSMLAEMNRENIPALWYAHDRAAMAVELELGRLGTTSVEAIRRFLAYVAATPLVDPKEDFKNRANLTKVNAEVRSFREWLMEREQRNVNVFDHLTDLSTFREEMRQKRNKSGRDDRSMNSYDSDGKDSSHQPTHGRPTDSTADDDVTDDDNDAMEATTRASADLTPKSDVEKPLMKRQKKKSPGGHDNKKKRKAGSSSSADSLDSSSSDDDNEKASEPMTQQELDAQLREWKPALNNEILYKLKEHQVEAINFLWKKVVLSTDKTRGCIIAHTMGLGKTLTTIAFIQRFIKENKGQRVLIVCPPNLLSNWRTEFRLWRADIKVYYIEVAQNDRTKELHFESFQANGGVLLIGYNWFTKFAEKEESTPDSVIYRSLINPGPDLVVADEAHQIKNEQSKRCRYLKMCECTRRVCLTGYPLQNMLKEYWVMVDFTKPSFLGNWKRFESEFAGEINKALDAKATGAQKKRARHLLKRLSEKLDIVCHRKDEKEIDKLLLGKLEFQVSMRLSPIQAKIYNALTNAAQTSITATGLLALHSPITYLLWDPAILKRVVAEREGIEIPLSDSSDGEGPRKQKKATRSPKLAPLADVFSGCEMDDDLTPDNSLSTPAPMVPAETAAKTLFSTMLRGENGTTLQAALGAIEDDNGLEAKLTRSPKMRIVYDILVESINQKERVLVFSQFKLILESITEMIRQHNHVQLAKNLPVIKFDGFDGKTKTIDRYAIIDKFQKQEQGAPQVLVLATKAGGIGINLTAASRVILCDVLWNPVHDVQAIGRAYRLTQTKHVFVYRVQAVNTLEDKMYKRNIEKRQLAQVVVDKKKSKAAFDPSEADLKTFTENYVDPVGKQAMGRNELIEIAEKDEKVFSRVLEAGDILSTVVQLVDHGELLEREDAAELPTEEEERRYNMEYEEKMRALDQPNYMPNYQYARVPAPASVEGLIATPLLMATGGDTASPIVPAPLANFALLPGSLAFIRAAASGAASGQTTPVPASLQNPFSAAARARIGEIIASIAPRSPNTVAHPPYMLPYPPPPRPAAVAQQPLNSPRVTPAPSPSPSLSLAAVGPSPPAVVTPIAAAAAAPSDPSPPGAASE